MNLKFGTGGLRATMGPGPDHLNLETIQEATLGVAAYAKEQSDNPSAAIAYDSRNHSEEFAREAARVLALKGCRAYIYPKLTPTPALSFAVRHLKCTVGICVTASHNPREYNGYKVYGSDGCQVTSEAADRIQKHIWDADRSEADDARSFEDFLEEGRIVFIDEKTIKAFLAAIIRKRTKKALTSDLKVVYTPLYGAGLTCVTSILKYIGVKNLQIVAEQAKPNGDFPTCPYPNPEDPKALELGIRWCEKTDADLLIATDPDSDRLGVVAKKNGKYERLNGNQVGILLLEYVLRSRQEAGTMPERPLVIRTIVSTSMTDRIAEHYGAEVIQTLTGFKWIGSEIGRLEKAGEADRYVFGFEESCGYLPGSYVRDKDGVGAAMLICELADTCKAQGKTLWDALDDLYKTYGHYETGLKTYEFTGDEADRRMSRIREGLQSPEGMKFAGSKVVRYKDYKDGIDGIPASNVLQLWMEDGSQAQIRPSGTEPKIKVYTERVLKG
ncbi:MAG TPA: phospho-sugar mutase [Candidatus Merdisoma merdipullorum]|nr:phospho-sugar mutase [Candidatus Merdisoma merdipullorum]